MVTFTLIQTDLFWEDKAANLAMLQRKIEDIEEHTDVIILPEMFTTGFTMQPSLFAESMDGETVSWMRTIATENKTIVCGSIIIEENSNYYNRFIWMQPHGQLQYYDKKHLFAFAGENNFYKNGNAHLITTIRDIAIQNLVCYDLRFPVWSRQQDVLFDVLIYVANWPERRSKAWKTLLVARAIENQCYVIGVNRVGKDGNGNYHSGDSMVVNAMGEVLYYKVDEEDVFTFSINKKDIEEVRTKLPFLNDRDAFKLL